MTWRRVLSILAILHVLFAGLGVLTGFLLSRDIPSVSQLDVFSLPQVTVLLDRDGEALESFGTERRIPVPLSEMSPLYLKAVVATEDPRFSDHFGVDPIAVARAVVSTVRSLDLGVEGASTITMQLARDQFLHKRKTIWRKLQEVVLATQIEKHYSKQEILELYCNRIYLGHGRFGVEAATRLYFDKRTSEVTLAEAALLAGLAQRPEALSPLRHPERALRRRDHVLRRMVIEGVISAREAEAALATPIETSKRVQDRSFAPHYIEEVRRWLIGRYGETGLYEEGMVVRTTLDRHLQTAAERAVRFGLDLYGRRHREIPLGEPLPEGKTVESFHSPAWTGGLRVDDFVPAVVMSVAPDGSAARLRVGGARFDVDADAIAWTGRKEIGTVLQAGTVVPVRILEVTSQGAAKRVELASAPTAEAALVALDVSTGEVLALVGGSDFEKSEFNLAVQGKRQAGSAFKPFVFAAALEQGFLPNQLIYDAPTVVVEPGAPEPYQPENYERDYVGYITLRHALEHSRNLATLRLLDAIGYDPAIDVARRLGIGSTLRAFPSLSLGAFECRLIDLVAAYGSFPNGGVLVKPLFVEEVSHREQQVLYRMQPEVREVVSAEVAAMMTSLLEGVVVRGTGQSARALRRPMGGKTGTTDDFTNAWFVGFTPSLAVGVWVGRSETAISLGRGETGARAALPIWIRFFEEGLGLPTSADPAEDFVRTPGMTRTLVDARTGLRANESGACGPALLETFPAGREPRRWCDAQAWARTTLPYPLQVFPIDQNLRLVAPPREMARIVVRAQGRIAVDPRRHVVRFDWPRAKDEVLRGEIALPWSDDDWIRYLDAETFERAAFRVERTPEGEGSAAGVRMGADGYPAEILEANRSGTVRGLFVPDDPR